MNISPARRSDQPAPSEAAGQGLRLAAPVMSWLSASCDERHAGSSGAIAALYADTAVYRSPAFRQPDLGLAGVRHYLNENLPAEENIECSFGQPIVSGNRAAVEWWGCWIEQGRELTFAGVTVPRFDDRGKVVEHCDYDNHVERRQPPYADW